MAEKRRVGRSATTFFSIWQRNFIKRAISALHAAKKKKNPSITARVIVV